MAMQLTRRAYVELIEQDIAALPESMPNLERAHIIDVLRNSVAYLYGQTRCGSVSAITRYSCDREAGHGGHHMQGLAVWYSEDER